MQAKLVNKQQSFNLRAHEHHPATFSASRGASRPPAIVARSQDHKNFGETAKKVVVIGAGWAGLGAAWHLAKQGYAVDVLEAAGQPGGLVAGWKTKQGRSAEVGIHGYWSAYYNIFSLCDELGLDPFTDWVPSHQYSNMGLEVVAPIFRDMPRLPTPLGHFAYCDFRRIPLADRLSALPLMPAVADFDNSDESWRRYDSMSALELFRRSGVTQRLFKDAFQPMLLVGLFAPGEQCSAAATLGMLKFFLLNHQQDFDVKWCRGTTGNMIFAPWIDRLEQLGSHFHSGHLVRDVQTDATGNITSVSAEVKGGGRKDFAADAVVFATGINGLKKIVAGSPVLSQREEFRRVGDLGSLDVLAVKIWLDRKVYIERASNAVSGFDEGVGWTFFDLTALHDEFADSPTTVLECDFYHAGKLLPLSDDELVAKVMHDVTACTPSMAGAKAVDFTVVRCPKAVTHFSPGCYRSLLRATTTFPNAFAAGDWIANTHGSFSQEKAYVTGLEAANHVVRACGQGRSAQVIPLEAEEGHVVGARRVIRGLQGLAELNPLARLLPQALV
ncbi:hypothetical protein WJX73_005739 [Symbiochloris irregularis]|uniref:Amine oxidase domain-containing protein n=1 Tax=Symbiochloris irregularis TaxID=706552 RepID=A0AAW1NPP8_9CHLO